MVFVLVLGWSILHKNYDNEVCKSIEEFLERVKADPNTTDTCKLPPISDKNNRKYIHQVVREVFPSLVSDTDLDCIILHSCKNQSISFTFT